MSDRLGPRLEAEESDDEYSPPEGPSNETVELFPGMSIDFGGKQEPPLPPDTAQVSQIPQVPQVPQVSDTPEIDLNQKNVAIQGTNIVLESEEDIQRWIAERRRKWPTTKRVLEKKKEAQKERVILQRMGGGNGLATGRVCKYWRTTGRCRNGNKCKFLHAKQQETRTHAARNLPHHKLAMVHEMPVQIPQRFSPLVNRGKSLNSLLVESEHIKDENTQLLDVFARLVKANIVSSDWDELKRKLGI